MTLERNDPTPTSPPDDDSQPNLFTELSNEVELPEEPDLPVEPSATPAPEPSPQLTEPTAEPVPPAALIPPQTPEVAVPPAQPTQSPPSAEVAPAPSPVEQPIDINAARQQFLAELEANYALSPEDVDRVNNEPASILPKLAARVNADVYEAVMRTVYAQLPQAVSVLNQVTDMHRRAEDEFFTAWPKLKGHEDTVGRLGQVYRQMNPQATKEQAMKDIGSIAMSQLGIPLVETPAPAPAAPPIPHSPPAAGSVAPAFQAGGRNIFEELSLHTDEDT